MSKYASNIRRTSLNLDLGLVAEAREVLSTNGTTDTVHGALAEVVKQSKLRRLAERSFALTPDEEIELERWGGVESGGVESD